VAWSRLWAVRHGLLNSTARQALPDLVNATNAPSAGQF